MTADQGIVVSRVAPSFSLDVVFSGPLERMSNVQAQAVVARILEAAGRFGVTAEWSFAKQPVLRVYFPFKSFLKTGYDGERVDPLRSAKIVLVTIARYALTQGWEASCVPCPDCEGGHLNVTEGDVWQCVACCTAFGVEP